MPRAEIPFPYTREYRVDHATDRTNRQFSRVDYRFDLPHGTAYVEVDERGHGQNRLVNDPDATEVRCAVDSDSPYGYNVLCEQARMTDIVNSVTDPALIKPILFVRYNPHGFQVDGVTKRTTTRERLLRLKEVLEAWRPTRALELQYMYYDVHTLEDETYWCDLWRHRDYSCHLLDGCLPPVI